MKASFTVKLSVKRSLWVDVDGGHEQYHDDESIYSPFMKEDAKDELKLKTCLLEFDTTNVSCTKRKARNSLKWPTNRIITSTAELTTF